MVIWGVILRVQFYKYLELFKSKSWLWGQQFFDFGNGIQGILVFFQNYRVGVIEESDEVGDEVSQVVGVVRFRAGIVDVEDDGSSLFYVYFRVASGF